MIDIGVGEGDCSDAIANVGEVIYSQIYYTKYSYSMRLLYADLD